MSFKLSSPSFEPGGKIPIRHSCDGANISSRLQWSGTPGGARSFALICADPDAPAGTWYHWAIFDIPPAVTALPEEHPLKAHEGVRHGINDFGRAEYGGPCPPHGHRPHHYHFTLYALDVDRLAVPASLRCRDVERAAKRHSLAQAELVGLYGR